MIKKWLLPCNIKNFDIIKAFNNTDIAYFKRNRYMTVGDFVYIYVASPYSEIMYKGIVLEKGIPGSEVGKDYSVSNFEHRTFVKVQLLQEFPRGTFPRRELFEHKLGQVVNQQLIRFELEEYIDSVEKRLGGM